MAAALAMEEGEAPAPVGGRAGVELRNVRKTFGDVEVIHGVDLSVEAGEFVVFVGPSGCGKSTLLRLVAGLEDTTGGTILIGERDVTHIEPADRGVAMVFQSYALYPHMTVAENMGFGLKMTGFKRQDVEARVKKAAGILHLEALLERKPKQLSGGQRQRVAIGRAIVREPQVFLFDEPLSNLDAELRVQMRLEIAKLHRELGATMIYVTHDQVEAMTLADKIVVLRTGRIEQVGSPLALYDDPDNMFVAGFLGSPKMNFLQARVAGSGDGGLVVELPELDGEGAPVRALVPVRAAAREGTRLVLGIRPEHLDPSAPPAPHADADRATGHVGFSLPVDVMENLGGVSFAYCRTGGEEPLVVELKNRSASEGARLHTGFDPARAYLFDPDSGERLK